MKNTHTRLTTGITALALTCSLGLNGCATTDQFNIQPRKDGSFVAAENSYIDNYYIDSFYVINVKSNITKENQIYIVRKYELDGDLFYYENILNNLEIYSNQTEKKKNNLEIIEETPLYDYLLAYDLVKSRYYYEDMVEIYNLIKENYSLSNSNSMSRKLIIKSTM